MKLIKHAKAVTTVDWILPLRKKKQSRIGFKVMKNHLFKRFF